MHDHLMTTRLRLAYGLPPHQSGNPGPMIPKPVAQSGGSHRPSEGPPLRPMGMIILMLAIIGAGVLFGIGFKALEWLIGGLL